MTQRESEELINKIVIDLINYWRKESKEQKEAILSDLNSLCKHYNHLRRKVAKIEPFDALKQFLDVNKPIGERINKIYSLL